MKLIDQFLSLRSFSEIKNEVPVFEIKVVIKKIVFETYPDFF